MTNIKTSVIGSYPIKTDNTNIMQDYFNQNKTSWNKYIDAAVHDMINSGVNMISDGQTRDPFIQLFTRKLKGCRIRDRTEIIDKIQPVSYTHLRDHET